MTQFRYAATNLITGAVLADNIPLNVESFSQQLNGGGTLTGELNLDQNFGVNAPRLAAIQPVQSVLWVLADNNPVWNGILYDWPDMSRASGTLPISAMTMDSILGHRIISATLDYDSIDLFAAFADLITYATTKDSAFISTVSPIQGPASPIIAAAAAIAGLVLPPASLVSGQTWQASYLWSDLTPVSSAISDMVAIGLEYAFVPGIDDDGNLFTGIYLGVDTGLGRQAAETGYTVAYPGNASDYGYQVTGSQSANYLWATAPPNGSAEQWESVYPHGVDVAALQAGFPLLEDTIAWQGSTVTEQAQIDTFADGQLTLRTQAMTQPVINIPDGLQPALAALVLGDVIPFAATSPIHPPGPGGTPGLQSDVRLTGWTMYPAGPQQSAYMQLTTSQTLAMIDNGGGS